tara:strand:- start:1646 stop:2284 length:639 start_codon:yes stop_codon:yes gene_type:complete
MAIYQTGYQNALETQYVGGWNSSEVGERYSGSQFHNKSLNSWKVNIGKNSTSNESVVITAHLLASNGSDLAQSSNSFTHADVTTGGSSSTFSGNMTDLTFTWSSTTLPSSNFFIVVRSDAPGSNPTICSIGHDNSTDDSPFGIYYKDYGGATSDSNKDMIAELNYGSSSGGGNGGNGGNGQGDSGGSEGSAPSGDGGPNMEYAIQLNQVVPR